TVFSSITRDPPRKESTMFWASCDWGPAAGPSGVDAAWPWKETERSREGSPRKNFSTPRSKMLRSRSSSRNIRVTRRPKGRGEERGQVRTILAVEAPLGYMPPFARGGALGQAGTFEGHRRPRRVRTHRGPLPRGPDRPADLRRARRPRHDPGLRPARALGG